MERDSGSRSVPNGYDLRESDDIDIRHGACHTPTKRQRLMFELLMKGDQFMVKLLSKQTTNKWYLADQLFDDHREELPVVIVSFQIHDGISDEVIRNLSISGFSWMGDRYFYLTTKNSSRTKSYFCRQFDDTIQNSYSIWSKIGSIRTLRSIPEIGMRLSLLVSSSYPGFTYFDSCDIDVQVIPDIAGTNLASICTDGSGFISSDLVSEHCFPRHVNQGIPLKSVSREIAKNSQSLWSLAYQIRFLCPLGLFKGTLIVDPYLKGKKIILRESMRKILPSPSCNCNIFALSIVNSPPILDCPRFESCYKLPLTVRFVQEKVETISCLVRRCCGCPLPVGSLNRHLILILHERYQIPVSVFSELAKDSMSNMRKVSTNVSDALNYCRTSSSPSVSCDFLHDIRSSISPSHNLGVVETLLSCGYTTSHPLSLVTSSLFLALIALFLQALLSQTRQKLFNNLLQGRLRCSGTCFLMGLPDPTHTLASDEVFVPGWSSCDCRHLYQDCYNGYCQDDSSVSLPIDTPTSDVLVSRFPLHSPEGIRKLHLINDCFCCSKKKAPLIEFFNPLGHFIPDVGGVIVFGSNPALSSQYNCPVVSDMNGDYDGDLYWVCTEPRLVNSFCDSKECRTRVSDEEMPPTESTFVSPIVDDLPLIHSPVENFLGVSQRLSVDSCRYLSLISLSFDEIQSKPSEIVMEALFWEGLTPFSNRHQCSLKNFCQHDSLTKYLKIVATTVGVARCEHLWNVKADIYGVESKEAQYYHRLHDKLLVSRKHGYYLHELLNNPHHPPVSHTDIQLISAEYLPPHYLLPRGLKNFKFMAGQHYYSTSILGKLSDLVRELESSDGDDPHDSEIQEQSSTTTIELDPQLQADFDICCCYNETYDGSSHDKRNHVIHQSWSDMARLVDPKSVKSTYLLAAQEIFMRFVAEMSSPSRFAASKSSDLIDSDDHDGFTSTNIHRTQLILEYQKKFFSLASDLTQQCGRCSNCLPDTPSSYYHLNSALKLSSAVYEVSHLLIHRPIIPSIRSREIKLMLYCWLLCGGFLAQLKTKDRILSSVVDVP